MVCGPGKWGDRIVPDKPLGAADFTVCCAHHDYGYAQPHDRSRKQVDQAFRRCMMKAAQQTQRPWLAALMARLYYRAVRLGGWLAWYKERSKSKNPPPQT